MSMKVFSKAFAIATLIALVALVIWFHFLPTEGSLRTVLPAVILGVSAAFVCLRGSFSSDKDKRAQWRAFGIICFCIVVACAIAPFFFDRQTHELIRVLGLTGVTVLCTGLGFLAAAGPIMILLVPNDDKLQYEVATANEVIETQRQRITDLEQVEEHNNSAETSRADVAEQQLIEEKKRLSQDLTAKQGEIDAVREQLVLAKSAKDQAERDRDVNANKVKDLEAKIERLSSAQLAEDVATTTSDDESDDFEAQFAASIEDVDFEEQLSSLRTDLDRAQKDLARANSEKQRLEREYDTALAKVKELEGEVGRLSAAQPPEGSIVIESAEFDQLQEQVRNLQSEYGSMQDNLGLANELARGLRDRIKDVGRIAFVRYEEHVGDIWSSANIYIVEPQDEDFCIGVYAVKNEKVVKSFARVIPAGHLMSTEPFANVHLDPDVTLQITPHVNLKLSAKAAERLGFSDKEIPLYAAG